MEDIDMSLPGSELFPELSNDYNSYAEPQVGNPLDAGVNKPEVAVQDVSDKDYNFRALRDEVSKMQSERDYWRGQADAYAKMPQYTEQQESRADAFSALDLDDSSDVRKAFDAIRQENNKLREEIKDALTAIETKSQRQDWNNMVTQHVPQLTSKNPIFAEMIQRASNPYEAAYLLAELNSRATQQAAPKEDYSRGERAVANANKPKSLASVGGNSTLSAADYYASMSDKDFMELAAKNLAGI